MRLASRFQPGRGTLLLKRRPGMGILVDQAEALHANGIFNADGVMSSLPGLRWLVDEGETS